MQVAELGAGRGAGWLTEAFALFRRRPLGWVGLCGGWVAITLSLLILIPFLGGIIANLLQPVFFASFAITAFKQAAGEPMVMGDLFTGFRRGMPALLMLGGILLVAEIGIFALMALLGLPFGQFTPEYLDALQGKEWILAAGFLVTAVVKGALWFAPPLIAFHGMSTAHAVRWSVYAALANFGAMVVYGITLTAIMFLGIIPWGLGLLVVMPMMVISTFTSYREVFEPRTP